MKAVECKEALIFPGPHERLSCIIRPTPNSDGAYHNGMARVLLAARNHKHPTYERYDNMAQQRSHHPKEAGTDVFTSVSGCWIKQTAVDPARLGRAKSESPSHPPWSEASARASSR